MGISGVKPLGSIPWLVQGGGGAVSVPVWVPGWAGSRAGGSSLELQHNRSWHWSRERWLWLCSQTGSAQTSPQETEPPDSFSCTFQAD